MYCIFVPGYKLLLDLTPMQSWPAPPIGKKKTAEIPQTFRMFGSEFRYNKTVDFNIERRPIDKKLIFEELSNSFKLFRKIIETNDTKYIQELEQLHTRINGILNTATIECPSQEEVIIKKNLLYDKINNIIN